MKMNDPISPSENVVAKNLDGEFVLLDVSSSTYFGLNPIGSRIWELISEQPRSPESVARIIAGEYDAEEAEVGADVLALAQDLLEKGLVVVVAD